MKKNGIIDSVARLPNFQLAIYLFFFPPAILGLIVGVLYKYGLISNEGWWVVVLNFLASIFLDKAITIVEVLGGVYVAVWALFGKLFSVYKLAKYLVIKCFLGITTVPVFCIFSGIWIAEFQGLVIDCLLISVEGYLLAWATHYMLEEKTSVK